MTRPAALLAAIALSALPSLASAMCSGDGHEKVTMSCADGSKWDIDAQRCVPTTS